MRNCVLLFPRRKQSFNPQHMYICQLHHRRCLHQVQKRGPATVWPVPVIDIWLGFLCLEWPLPPSVAGLVCGHQRKVKKSGKEEYASFSVVIARSRDNAPHFGKKTCLGTAFLFSSWWAGSRCGLRAAPLAAATSLPSVYVIA